ncbi:uncharacterized protein NPIL_389961 [Nephila pilipes]|uniref:Uncharacterized protein n=1 Tax=Nephila pilipes TaxID=299642 RepID=A0A8X6QRP8_NEPPI|nr:uncharacterized protein NPIL_389961 [Nephila pilipes]
MIAKYIACVVPKSCKKYILPILEELRDVNYTFNDMGELQKDGKTEYRSHTIDSFSYLIRNVISPSQSSPGFNTFLGGISDTNIPLDWITNKYVKDSLLLSQMDLKRKEPSSVITPESSKVKKLTTAERLLYNPEKSPEIFETQSKK